MIIGDDILERACKDMIETILFCLRTATKGTIYRVGPMPDLRVVRVTSGVRNNGDNQITWGFPEISDYDHPGKSWEQYRDLPGRAMEAMAWCVEKGKSWTADDPHNDSRSVRKQVSNEIEDHHHMEPVLIRKSYLYGDHPADLPFPLNHQQKPIWQECEYVVVAVVKIHFVPGGIRRGDNSTKIIKKLSRILGTELLSQHVRETVSEAQKELARQRLQSCNVLAHELRNTLIKLGFIFSAINAEISFLREQWELQIDAAYPDIETKHKILDRLDELANSALVSANGSPSFVQLCEILLREQKDLSTLPLMPGVAQRWVEDKLLPKWRMVLNEDRGGGAGREEIQSLLARLQRVVWLGTEEEIARNMPHLTDDIKREWPRIAYTDFTVDKVFMLDHIIEFLENPSLSIPHKQQTKKVLIALKALVEMIPEVEERANRIIHSLKNGGSHDML